MHKENFVFEQNKKLTVWLYAKHILTLLIILFFTTIIIDKDVYASESPQKVFAENGNIFYCPDGKNKTQLTFDGKDRAPVLSPDGKYIAFIRKSDKEAYLSVGNPEDYLQSGSDGILADQVWILNVATKKERCLAWDKNPDIPNPKSWDAKKVIAYIDDRSLQFSPDSRKAYFITSAWVTSGALHSVNVDGSNEHYIVPANEVKVIDKGCYKGNIIINQHRYFLVNGSYDWYYVFTSSGKEIGALGNDLEKIDWDMLYSD